MGTVGIVGAGTMGAGIARLALASGYEVRLHDVDRRAAIRARDRVITALEKTGGGDRNGSPEPLWIAEDLERLVLGADLIIEAASENLRVKQSIFHALGGPAAPDAILATNTSALRLRDIADPMEGAERLVGLHFFNPAHRMRLVEVASWSGTNPQLIPRVTKLMRTWGKVPIACADTPGFIVNRVNRPFTLQALRLLEAGRATIPEIDATLELAGYPMGPFRLMDLIGIDTNLFVSRGLWEAFDRDSRFEPSPIQDRLVGAGHLGIKSGAGFYLYQGTAMIGVNPALRTPLCNGSVGRDEILRWIESAILNEAYEALGDGVTGMTEIDRALELGAGHPVGPFALAKLRGGVRHSLEAVQRLEVETLGRYRTARALIEAAANAR